MSICNRIINSLPILQAWAANYWANMGCPRRKLIIGMPAFGRSFKLKTPYKHRVSAQAKGPGPAGPFLKEEGRYSYFEVWE